MTPDEMAALVRENTAAIRAQTIATKELVDETRRLHEELAKLSAPGAGTRVDPDDGVREAIGRKVVDAGEELFGRLFKGKKKGKGG